MSPGVLGAWTTIVMFGASAPAARFPPVRSHVTVPKLLVHVQPVSVLGTNVVPAGRVSTTFTAEASSGPALCTPIVYVRFPFRATGSGESALVIERSASPAATESCADVTRTTWLSVDAGWP